MRVFCVLLAVVCVFADDSEDRRSKPPFIADAVGNVFTPASNGPVGSPVHLLTPDRYEFYTFDESGELVKRLMTLEEIQAIVAAGEETEGLVTFAYDNKPTIAFNFSQPPYTKVHNVVTNVQNVLKAQMEAHKNKPPTKPTLDTPDVSDSWSLILPSIFGNTGVNIVPDKTSGTFSTPETETIEFEEILDDDNSLHKEGSNVITSSTDAVFDESQKDILVTETVMTTTERVVPLKITSTSHTLRTTTTTTSKPTRQASTSAQPLSTKTSKPLSTDNTNKPYSATTSKPLSTVTNKPRTTTTNKPRSTTTYKSTTNYKSSSESLSTNSGITKSQTKITSKPTSTTVKPRATTTEKTTTKATVQPISKTTTAKLSRTSPRPFTASSQIPTTTIQSSTKQKQEENLTKIQTFYNTVSNVYTTDKASIKYEQINTFVPVSTAAYVTERTTVKAKPTIKPPIFSSTTKISIPAKPLKQSYTATKIQPTTYKPTSSLIYDSTSEVTDFEKLNITTIPTQSVSPSTTVASPEFVSIGTFSHITKNKPSSTTEKLNNIKEPVQYLPLFDISESFSQIASDLGNYQPVPTSSDLPEVTKINDISIESIESKDSLEIDIPEDKGTTTEASISNNNDDIYIKISTIFPPCPDSTESFESNHSVNLINSITSTDVSAKLKSTTDISITSTIDPIVSGSMEDLLSQIVNQAPQNIVELDKSTNEEPKITTENLITSTIGINTSKLPAINLETTTVNIIENLSTASEIVEYATKSDSDDENDSRSKNQNLPINNVTQDYKTENSTPEKGEDKNKIINEPEVVENQTETVDSETSTSLKPDLEGQNSETNDTKPNNINNLSPNYTEEDKISESLPSTDNVLSQSSTTEKIKSSLEEDNKTMVEPESVFVKTENTLSQPDITDNKLITINGDSNVSIQHQQNGSKVDEFKKKIQKVNIDDKELTNQRNNSWKLIPTVAPPNASENLKEKLKSEMKDQVDNKDKHILLDHSTENQGLEVTTKDLGKDVIQFTELCNELAFRYWQTMIQNIDKKRSFVLSPYSVTSMLAMIFMGARGATSGEMNDILKLDDMVTFNPHFTLKNVSDSIETGPNSGVMVSAFIRELFSNRDKGRILTFYKERANHFYNGHVEEVNFKLISDIIRRRTNLLVKRYTWGRIPEYMKSNTIAMQPPLAAFSANIFQTDCSESSVDGRDGEMYFVVSPNVRQRRLVPVPAVVYRTGFLAGYDPSLDATAAALGSTNSIVSTLFLMPGQQGNVVHSDDLEALEKRMLDSNPTTATWNRLLRTLLPRIGLELQIPRFLHKSIFNVSSTLQQMGLKDLFAEERADLGGVIGPMKDLYVSDMIQSTTFVTCGEGAIGEQHHMEEYPDTLGGPQRRRTSRWATGWEEPRDYQRAFHDPHDVGEAMHLPLHLRPRQARLPARNTQPARLKFDRPFLYFVRHNPTGMLLYVGRYNPRLLP